MGTLQQGQRRKKKKKQKKRDNRQVKKRLGGKKTQEVRGGGSRRDKGVNNSRNPKGIAWSFKKIECLLVRVGCCGKEREGGGFPSQRGKKEWTAVDLKKRVGGKKESRGIRD